MTASGSAGGLAAARHLKPLPRATLPQEIVAAIADLIMQRVWKPGDRIPAEKQLAERFAVGRSTIREAIKSLVILGVVDARPGDGSYICESTSDLLSGAFQWGSLLTDRNLDDLVALRVLVEVECAGLAARQGASDVAPTLLDLCDRMGENVLRPQEFMALDNQFHKVLAAATGNALYQSLSSTLQSLVAVWYARTFQIEQTKGATIAEHRSIALAVAGHDEPAAREAMARHLHNAADRLHKVVSGAA